MDISNYIDSAQERVRIDTNNTSSLLQHIRILQENSAYWAIECEKLHTLGWYKFGFVASCVLNLVFIFGIVGLLWLKL